MKRILATVTALAALMAFPAGPAGATHDHVEPVQGPSCESKWRTPGETCTFRYQGGRLYVGASARGTAAGVAGGATVRLEARSRITGERRVLLSCTTSASGGCGASGNFDTVERPQRGQRLFCVVEGVGRGSYECGTIFYRN